MTGNARAT